MADIRNRKWDRFKELSDEAHVSEDHQFWDKVYFFTKYTFSGLLLLTILSLSIVSKGASLILTWNLFTPHAHFSGNNSLKTLNDHLNYSGNIGKTGTGNQTKLVEVPQSLTDVNYVWALFMMLVTPYCITTLFYLLRVICKGGSGFKLRPFLVAFASSTLEAVGLSIFVFSVLPALDPFSGLFYCNSITFIPALLQTIVTARTTFSGKTERKHRTDVAFFILALIGVVLVIPTFLAWGLWTENSSLTGGQVVMLIVAPFLVSCGSLENFLPDRDVSKSNESHTEIDMNGMQPNGYTGSSQRQDTTQYRKPSKLYRIKDELIEGRYVIFCIVNIWKILVTFGMVLVIFGTSCKDEDECISAVLGLNKTTTPRMSSDVFGETVLYHGTSCDTATPFIVAITGMVASLVCHRLCIAAVKIVAQVACFYVPIILTTPVAFIVGVIIVTEINGGHTCTFPFPWWTGDLSITNWWYVLIAAACGYLSLIFSTTFMWTNETKRMEDRIFFKPLYCGALFDQSLLLNRLRKYKRSSKPEKQLGGVEATKDNDVIPKEEVPLLYLCATMWHETETEMTQILTSLFRMDIDQCVRSLMNVGQADYYEFEAHIFFDDAFKPGSVFAGEYVEMFMKAIKQTASKFYPQMFPLKTPEMYSTPYGGRIVYTLPGENKLIVHLKDKAKIRIKKRWSQVMYMYYFLSHKLSYLETEALQEKKAENTFILALDGDVDFRPQAVKLLLDRMKRNPLVGAACGRIHPIGKGPMVWYQKFEYAVSHWLIKSTEHVTGCVLCSPGCFSVFRGSALMECNVMKRYTTMPSEARHHIQYDQGEDRWLCTLLLKQGMKIDYCAASDAYTFAPEGFKEFFKQRRRWTPSTMANVLEILEDWRIVTSKNNNMSVMYILLQVFWFASSIVTPGVLFLMIVGATNLAYPAMSLTVTLFINLVPIVIFILICFLAKEDHQLNFAAGLSIVYSLVMMIVLVGLIRQSVDQGLCSITTIFLIFVAGVFVIAGFSHPKELGCLLHGPLFFLAIPSMSMFLMVYSIINLNNVSWGTRETAKPQEKEADGTKTKATGVSKFLEKLRVSCSCCQTRVRPKHEKELVQKLERALTRLEGMETNKPADKKNEPKHQNFVIQPSTSGQQTSQASTSLQHSFHLKFDSDVVEKLDAEEEKFWNWLIETYLYPLNVPTAAADDKAPNVTDVKTELTQLRNSASLAFLLINALFVTVIFFLQLANADTQGGIAIHIKCVGGQDIKIEPISMTFTLVFGILLAIQFICMLFHRWKTFLQINSVTSFRREINVEQMLIDAFEDIIEERKEEDAKSGQQRRKSVIKPLDLKDWLSQALGKKIKATEEITENKGNVGSDVEPARKINRFKGVVRTVSKLTRFEKSLRSMSATDRENFNKSVTVLKHSLKKTTQSAVTPVEQFSRMEDEENTVPKKIGMTLDLSSQGHSREPRRSVVKIAGDLLDARSKGKGQELQQVVEVEPDDSSTLHHKKKKREKRRKRKDNTDPLSPTDSEQSVVKEEERSIVGVNNELTSWTDNVLTLEEEMGEEEQSTAVDCS